MADDRNGENSDPLAGSRVLAQTPVPTAALAATILYDSAADVIKIKLPADDIAG